METHNEQLSPDELYEQGMAHFRAARWAEALAAFREIQSRGDTFAEIEALIADIQLKQGMEQIQAPQAAAPPRRGQGRLIGIVAGGLLALGLLVFGGVRLLSAPAALPAIPQASEQAIIAALPTAAPAEATAPAVTASAELTGTLAVRTLEGDDLAVGIDTVYIIFDASGSMLASVAGQRKIDIAQEAMGQLVSGLPGDIQIALRTYGRQRPDDCSDIELVSPPGPLDQAALIDQINAIEPVNLSRTPIASSLAQIPADLGAAAGETLVVLVSDGEENCEGDPVAVAEQIHTEQPNLRISVVGFDIAPELRERLAAIALAGGGSYFDAGDVAQLTTALNQVVSTEIRVLDMDGREVSKGPIGDPMSLPAGAYNLVVGADTPLLEQPIEIRPGLATLVTLSKENGALNAQVTRDWQP